MRAPFRWSGIERILITHLHGDHCYGVPGLLGTLSLNGHTAPITVQGPPGLRRWLEAVLETTPLHLRFPLELVEIDDGTVEQDGYSIGVRRLDHSVPTCGYRVIEDDRPGRLDIGRARDLGVPEGPLLGRLKSGETIVLDNGTAVHGADLVGATQPGRRIAYCLDTRPCDASIDLARNATVLIHEATYGEEHANEARERWHSTAREAATIAEAACVRDLLLTHFSPRYLDTSVLVTEARAVFPQTDRCEELRVYDVLR